MMKDVPAPKRECTTVDPPRRWPDFFIVGAPRCGTTALYSFLRRHPDLFLPPANKEPHYFAPDLDSGSDLDGTFFVRSEEKYLSLFEEAGDAARVGEASTLYLYSQEAAKRIRESCGAARIIITVRDPVEIMYSFHSHRLRQGSETITDFAEALEAEAERRQGQCIPPECRIVKALFYRDLASLSCQIERYLEVFDREAIHFVVYDEFVTSVEGVYWRLLEFLGVDPAFEPEFRRVNPNRQARSSLLQWLRKSPLVLAGGRAILPQAARRWLVSTAYVEKPRPQMDPALRQRLQGEFEPEVRRLSELLDRDLSRWTRSPDGGP